MIPDDPKIIAFAGDWHGDTAYAERAIYAAAVNGAEVLVHVGDFGFRFPKTYLKRLNAALEDTGMNLIFVRGNHDDPDLLDGKWRPDEQGFKHSSYAKDGDRIHYCPQGHRWNWWGKTFMGLGGAHSVDRQWRTSGLDWWPNEWISTMDMYKAMQGPVDVMVTHDLPAAAKLPNDRKGPNSDFPAGEIYQAQRHRQLLQAVVDEVQPKLLVHGHFHARYAQMVGQLRVICLDMNGSSFRDNLLVMGPDLSEIEFVNPPMISLPALMVIQELADTKAEAQRLIAHSKVQIDGHQVDRVYEWHDILVRQLQGKTITSDQGRAYTYPEDSP